MNFFYYALLFLLPITLNGSCQQTNLNNTEIEQIIHIPLQKDELLYKDLISLSVDHPNVTISQWNIDKDAVECYDKNLFKETKLVYHDSVTVTVHTKKNDSVPVTNAHLYCTYFTSSSSLPRQEIIPLNFNTVSEQKNISCAYNSLNNSAENNIQQKKEVEQHSTQSSYSWSESLSSIIEKTSSLPIRLLLVFLLGVLLSLTPCIYPMIPITVGVLQTHGSKTIWYNIIVSFAYTAGIATTFAIFGLLAGCLGPLCGKLLMKPAFIIGLILILAYFAFSMFGFYEIKMPTFKHKYGKQRKGSLLSAFLLGAASGTIASPCVSPGLALLLSVVATLGNSLLGFLLLFTFGIGLSTPLLLVGAFSSSLQMLPQAGSWMIEVKKFFGFLMLGVCFYYMSYIIPSYILLWPFALFIAFIGVYYTHLGTFKITGKIWKGFVSTLGIMSIALSIFVGVQAVKYTFYPEVCHQAQDQNCWYENYQQARRDALERNTFLFIDCWARFCSVCIAINNGILKNEKVVSVLNQLVPLKVDGSFDTNEPYNTIRTIYSVTGFPTFMLVDPKTETIIKKWGAELYSMKPEDFINQLQQYLK